MVPACSILVIQPTRLCHLRFRYNFYRVENFIILEELEDLKRIFKKDELFDDGCLIEKCPP